LIPDAFDSFLLHSILGFWNLYGMGRRNEEVSGLPEGVPVSPWSILLSNIVVLVVAKSFGLGAAIC
jgi:hypothetical protein